DKLDQTNLARKRLIDAEFAFAEKDYIQARSHAIESLKASGDSILVLNLLGKILMQTGEHASALKCFEKAQNLSPRNIERLCSIAEVQTELGNANAATEAISHAEALDPDSVQVNETKAKVALAKGGTKTATRGMAKLESLSTLL